MRPRSGTSTPCSICIASAIKLTTSRCGPDTSGSDPPVAYTLSSTLARNTTILQAALFALAFQNSLEKCLARESDGDCHLAASKSPLLRTLGAFRWFYGFIGNTGLRCPVAPRIGYTPSAGHRLHRGPDPQAKVQVAPLRGLWLWTT